MKDSDQKKTIKLAALPNVEVFGLLNCMVKPGTTVDDAVNKKRYLKITPMYDDWAVVGIMSKPIYRISDSGEIFNVMSELADLSVVKLPPRKFIDKSHVLMDWTTTLEADLVDYPTYYARKHDDKDSRYILIDLRICTVSNDTVAEYDIKVDSSIFNRDHLCTYVDLYIDDEYTATLTLPAAIMRRDTDEWATSSNTLLFKRNLDALWRPYTMYTYESGFLTPVTPDSVYCKLKEKINNPINFKFVSNTVSSKHIVECFYLYVEEGQCDNWTVDEVSYRDFDGCHLITTNSEISHVVTLRSKIENFYKKYQCIGIPLMRYNGDDSVNLFPEAPHASVLSDISHQLMFNFEHVNDYEIRFSINNSDLQRLMEIAPFGANNQACITLIPKIGRLTTEKPNTP